MERLVIYVMYDSYGVITDVPSIDMIVLFSLLQEDRVLPALAEKFLMFDLYWNEDRSTSARLE